MHVFLLSISQIDLLHSTLCMNNYDASATANVGNKFSRDNVIGMVWPVLFMKMAYKTTVKCDKK